jgi:UDP-glucose 4-epimerase
MKRILITGCNGLIGESLVQKLKADESLNLTGIGRSKNSQINIFNIDLSKEWSDDSLPKEMDVIIHLAQSEKFRDFPETSIEVFNVNTYSTLKLLEYGRKAGVKKFIYASSGGVYGSSANEFNEDSPLVSAKDLGFYLSTKFCSEMLVENYSNFFDISILRLFFVYGPKQRKDMLIPRLIDSVKNGKEIKLQGESGIKINPIYVDDAASAIQKTLSIKGNFKFNIAGPEVLSLRDIVETISESTGIKPVYDIDKTVTPKNLVADIGKMTELLLEPKIKFKEGLKNFK